jgi:hypothetical protein
MRRVLIALLVLPVALFLAGCAGKSVKVNLTSLSACGRPCMAPGSRVHVWVNPAPDEWILNNDMRMKTEYLLHEAGYAVTNLESAQYVVVIGFGTGWRQETQSRTEFQPGQALESLLAGVNPQGLVEGVAMGMSCFQKTSELVDINDTWIYAAALDARVMMTGQGNAVVWESSGFSSRERTEVPGPLDYILVSLFEGFGSATGDWTEVSLKAKDRRVEALEGAYR